MAKRKTVTVFCGFSPVVHQKHLDVAHNMGKRLAKDHLVVWGCGNQGCMGSLAKGVVDGGGEIHGVTVSYFHELGYSFDGVEVKVHESLELRCDDLYQRGDIFVALSGGYGTAREIFHVLDNSAVNVHRGLPFKPLIIVNTGGFYDDLLRWIKLVHYQKFAPESTRQILTVVPDPKEAMAVIERLLD